MKEILEVDSIRFTDSNYDEGYSYYIPSIEMSDNRSLKNFVTLYVKALAPTIDENVKEFLAFQEKAAGVLPNPGYHDRGFFHLSETSPKLGGVTQHYHVLMDKQPNRESVIELIDYLNEQLKGRAFAPSFKREIQEEL